MSYKGMNRKTFWLVAVVLLAMLPLSLGYVHAQITGFIPVFVDEDGTEDASVIFQSGSSIGIGTTSPATNLESAGSIRVTGVGPVPASGIGLELEFFNGQANVFGFDRGSGTFQPLNLRGSILSMNTEPGAGNVGIGTTDPGTKLHVQGSGLTEGKIQSVNERAILSLDSTINGTNRVWTLESGAFGNAGLFAIFDRTAFQARLAITPGGAVGIGTTTPDAQLEVRTPGAVAVRGRAAATGACAIDGIATATTGTADGIRGVTNSPSGRGVVATSAGGSPANLGLQVFGRGNFTGTVSKGGGSFKIDHPLDPANKYLYHSFVESPDMMNIYNGNVTLDAHGEAVVMLPDWFAALNQEFRYQLTNIGGFAPVYIAEEISGNRFKIAGGNQGGKVSWQVTGIRKDPFAEKYRIPVEEEKSAVEQGYYLHPEAYGQPETKNIRWANDPEGMQRMLEERENSSQLQK